MLCDASNRQSAISQFPAVLLEFRTLGISIFQNMISTWQRIRASLTEQVARWAACCILVRFILLIVGARIWIGLMNGYVVECANRQSLTTAYPWLQRRTSFHRLLSRSRSRLAKDPFGLTNHAPHGQHVQLVRKALVQFTLVTTSL